PHGGVHAPPTSTPPPAATAPSSPDKQPNTPISVRLPTGALVGLSLAAAISIAVAAARLRRRRRRAPDPDHLAVGEPEPALPPAIRILRKAHLDTYAATGQSPPSDVQLVDADFTTEAPTHLTVGIRDAEQLTVVLSGLSVGLDGPGATDVARAMATELLAGAHRSRIELVTTRRAAMTLFTPANDHPDQLANTLPGLVVTPDLDTALRHLETEVVHRARMMNDYDAPHVTALRAADPAEHLPTIMLIATAHDAEHSTPTLNATLQLAGRYGIGGVLLGAWPAGTTCRIDTDGQVLDAEGPHADTWANARLFHLTPADTAELLQTIRAARDTDEAAPAPPAEDAAPPQDSDEHPANTPATLQSPDIKDAQTSRPVRLRIFGPVSVETTDAKITTGLRRISRDLLAFLALHPEGTTREEAIDAIWQDRDLRGGSTMFHTAINNTRQTLRKTTSLREPMFITYAAGRYHLDHNLIDVDLWHFLRALQTAANAANDPDRVPALRHIADLYTGELADDLTYEWAERERERIRRTAIDALVRLANILKTDHPDDALTVLEQAFEHDPISEPLACDLMRLQADLGNLDAVRRTHRLLAYRLNDLDIDPDPETDRLLADLLRRGKKPPGMRPT
ncbi:BTAD domain-containing putative transcriptional regulator, partial [Actinomadura sp. 7K507]|uniref:AfsR/SARP family transcriptional regulator n=1 Tax=Actinomadura sp. 7K507 TaxID=2530365 RepID=UPI001A9E1228